jgi:hypothetical protein
MKNIHVLKTDKPSRLWLNNLLQGKLELSIEVLPYNTAQHIYITSSELPEEGGWHYNLALNIVEKTTEYDNGLLQEKIILTTDPDLIADGIQTIDDDFLEWFVKNPSCEKVEVKSLKTIPALQLTGNNHCMYQLIIPKEEPKQETLEEFINSQPYYGTCTTEYLEGIEEGAKWQQQRMYSEAIEFAEWIRIKDLQTTSKDNWIGLDMKYYTSKELFEQFKKK